MNMKTISIFLMMIASAIAQAPKSYTVARTDQIVTQLPVPMPNWGGATGAGKKVCFPSYNGICVIRLTDRNTLSYHASLFTGDTGEVQLTSTDSKHVIVHTSGGGSAIVAFDPVKETATGQALLSFNYEPQASEHSDTTLFALHGTQIQQQTVSADWTAVTSHVVLFDFASAGCLGATFKSVWHGVFSFAGNPEVFGTSYSATGPQGSGRYVVSWSKEAGCAVWDTVAGTVKVGGKVIGTVNMPDRFYMHAGSVGRNPQYAVSDPTLHQPNGKTGCLMAAGCYQQYFWKIGTLEVSRCGPPHNKPPYCDGHIAQTKSAVLSGRDYREHSWSDPAIPYTSIGQLSPLSADSHQSSTNGADLNGPTLFIFGQAKPAPKVFTVWGTDEIMALALDHTKRIWRFGPNGNTGTSKYFVCHDSPGVAFQQGNFALFTSDMGGAGALGYEADGKTPACDVFAIEAK